MSLRRLFKFSKPKTPGYGISQGFYLSVLSGHAQLPTPGQVANPTGEAGAVEGFIAPMMSGAQKEDLGRPMERGVYAIASKDRKTVLRLRVVSKEEAGFDPEPIVRSALAPTLSEDALARIRATWTLLQLTFESHDPDVSPSLAFAHAIVRRLAELTEGVVADPIAQRYLLPPQVPSPDPASPPSAPEHVSVRTLEREGKLGAFTMGMQKFALPEYELNDLEHGDEAAAGAFLLSVGQARLDGQEMAPGDRVGAKSAPFDVAAGGLDRARWEGIPVLELLPGRGATASGCLEAWRREQSA